MKDALCVSLSDSLCFYTCPCLLVRGASEQKQEVRKVPFVFLSAILFAFIIPVHAHWSVGHENENRKHKRCHLCFSQRFSLLLYLSMSPGSWDIRIMYENRKYERCPLCFSQRFSLLLYLSMSPGPRGIIMIYENKKYKRWPLGFSQRFSLLYTCPCLLVSEESAWFIKIGSTDDALFVFLYESVCHIPLSIGSTKDALCVSLSDYLWLSMSPGPWGIRTLEWFMKIRSMKDALCVSLSDFLWFNTCPCLRVRGASAWLAEGSWTSWNQPATGCRSCNRCWSRLKIHKNFEERLPVHKSSGP